MRRHAARRATVPTRTRSTGPNSASAGVPIAAAMCIGAESTPANARAQRGQRGQLRQRQRAGEIRRRARASAGRTAASTAVVSARSRSSGAPVTTTASPSATMRSSSAAVRSAGQHLNSQREPGCTCTNSRGASAVLGEQRGDLLRRPRRPEPAPGGDPPRRDTRRCAAARPGSARPRGVRCARAAGRNA